MPGRWINLGLVFPAEQQEIIKAGIGSATNVDPQAESANPSRGLLKNEETTLGGITGWEEHLQTKQTGRSVGGKSW